MDADPPGDGEAERTTGARARLSALTGRARRESERARLWAEDARESSSLVALGFDLVERDRLRLGGLLAGALAYRMFLWLLPFTLFVVGLLGAVTSVEDGAPDEVTDSLGLHGVLAELVSDGAEQRGWWIAMLIGLAGTLYAGLGAVKALRVSHAAAWGIRPGRGPNPLRASLWLAAVVVGLLLVAALAAWVRTLSGLAGILLTLAVTAVYFLVWLRVSSALPHRPVSARGLVPGALLVAVGIQVLHLVTVYYLQGRAERAASLYGAIGAALTLLVWLFLVARLIVGAAVLNAHFAREHEREAPAGE